MLRLKKTKKTRIYDHIPLYKMLIIFLIMLFTFGVIVHRMLDLQLIRQDFYQEQSEKNIYSMLVQLSPRGTIFDRNGIKLAEDITSFHLYIEPAYIENKEFFSAGLLKAIPVDQEKLINIFEKSSFPGQIYLLKSNLEDEEIARFKETQFQFDPQGKGAIIREGYKRHYPHQQRLSHVLGHTGIISSEDLKNPLFQGYQRDDRIGRQGLERYYESLLRGTHGIKIQHRDVFGRVLEESIVKEVEKGQDLYLTIDIRLQKKVEELLKGHTGACIVMNVHTGEILALASYPDYNPNIFSQVVGDKDWSKLMERRALFNIAIQGTYAPGSTFKALPALFALNQEIISPQERITCRGFVEVEDMEGRYQCWVFPGSHGPLNMTQAMKVSCDVYFYELAKKFPIESFLQFTQDFGGLAQYSGIDLPFENPGFLGSPQYKLDYIGYPWFDGDSMNLGIGQGFISVTPLQLTNIYARIANGGKLIQPRLFLRSSPDITPDALKKQKKVEQYKISMENLERLQNDLKEVTKPGGTAPALHLSKIPIAAKTGTAQGPYAPDGSVTWDLWLTGFAPADNPQIVATMMLENSETFNFGGDLSPFIRDIVETWFELQQADGGNNA